MRDDPKLALKKIKQQTNALCLRFGFFYDGTHWIGKHLQWLRALKLPELIRETLNEYLATYSEQSNDKQESYSGSYQNSSNNRNRHLGS